MGADGEGVAVVVLLSFLIGIGGRVGYETIGEGGVVCGGREAFFCKYPTRLGLYMPHHLATSFPTPFFFFFW